MIALAERRCLVTGAGGFVGAAICRALLAHGAIVHGTLRPNGSRWRLDALPELRTLAVDLRNGDAVVAAIAESRPNFVFHAACHNARRYDDPLAAIVESDVLTTAHLLDACAEAGIGRLVHLASSLEGSDALRGRTKAAATDLVRHQSQHGRLSALAIAPFHVYGPWESPDRLVPTAIRAAVLGEPMRLTGDAAARDFVFVDDLATACLAAAKCPAPDGVRIEIGSGIARTNRQLLDAVESVTGRDIQVEEKPYPLRATDHGAPRFADPKPARRLLGWRPTTSLTAGLDRTVRWMRETLLTSVPSGDGR